jgi:hypothetical protein
MPSKASATREHATADGADDPTTTIAVAVVGPTGLHPKLNATHVTPQKLILQDMATSSHIFFGAAAPDAVGNKRTKMDASSSGSSSSDDERLALTEESRAALLRQNELVTDMKLQMRFRTIAAPTLDSDVRMKLR